MYIPCSVCKLPYTSPQFPLPALKDKKNSEAVIYSWLSDWHTPVEMIHFVLLTIQGSILLLLLLKKIVVCCCYLCHAINVGSCTKWHLQRLPHTVELAEWPSSVVYDVFYLNMWTHVLTNSRCCLSLCIHIVFLEQLTCKRITQPAFKLKMWSWP